MERSPLPWAGRTEQAAADPLQDAGERGAEVGGGEAAAHGREEALQQKREEELKALEEKAMQSLKKIPKWKPCLENLSIEARIAVWQVDEGNWGTCSRCRRSFVGCLSCSRVKTLAHFLKKEGFDADGVDLESQVEI